MRQDRGFVSVEHLPPVCAVLLPHARAILDLTSSGLWQIAQYL